jgi:hypothetical protein
VDGQIETRHSPLPPGKNSFAVNKYYITYVLHANVTSLCSMRCKCRVEGLILKCPTGNGIRHMYLLVPIQSNLPLFTFEPFFFSFARNSAIIKTFIFVTASSNWCEMGTL